MMFKVIGEWMFSHPLSMWCPKVGHHIAFYPTDEDVNKGELLYLLYVLDEDSCLWCLSYLRDEIVCPRCEDDDIEQQDVLHIGDDSYLLEGVGELNDVDDGIGWDACAIDGDVGLLKHDVHIGCHECTHIPDGICLTDSVVGLDDELVDIDDIECDVKD